MHVERERGGEGGSEGGRAGEGELADRVVHADDDDGEGQARGLHDGVDGVLLVGDVLLARTRMRAAAQHAFERVYTHTCAKRCPPTAGDGLLARTHLHAHASDPRNTARKRAHMYTNARAHMHGRMHLYVRARAHKQTICWSTDYCAAAPKGRLAQRRC